MDARIRPGGPGQGYLRTKEDGQRLLYLFLYRTGIFLDLETAVIGAFIGNLKEISGHGDKCLDDRYWPIAPVRVLNLPRYTGSVNRSDNSLKWSSEMKG